MKEKKNIKRMNESEYAYYYLITGEEDDLNFNKITVINKTKTESSINFIDGWREPKASAKGTPVKLESLYHPEATNTIKLINTWKEQLNKKKELRRIIKDVI